MTAEQLEELLGKVTQGEWRKVPMGGSSTVLTSNIPPRNDQRANCTYGFRGEEYCVAYPFIEDNGKSFRIDFVCFGHDDATLIALAPSLARRVLAAEKLLDVLNDVSLCDLEGRDMMKIVDAVDAYREASK